MGLVSEYFSFYGVSHLNNKALFSPFSRRTIFSRSNCVMRSLIIEWKNFSGFSRLFIHTDFIQVLSVWFSFYYFHCIFHSFNFVETVHKGVIIMIIKIKYKWPPGFRNTNCISGHNWYMYNRFNFIVFIVLTTNSTLSRKYEIKNAIISVPVTKQKVPFLVCPVFNM